MSALSSVSSGNTQWPDFSQLQTNLFNQADTTGKGYLNEDDLKSLMEKNPRLAKDLTAYASGTSGSSASVDDVFKKLNTAGDGKITAAEFKSGLTAARHAAQAGQADQGTNGQPPDFSQMLQSIFQSGATNADGSMSQSDLASMMKKNPGLARDLASLVTSSNSSNSSSSDPLGDIYSKLDTDGDGKVTADEFTTAVTKAHDALMQQSTSSSSSVDPASSDGTSQSAAAQRFLIDLLQKLQQQDSAYAPDGTVNSPVATTSTFQATA